MRYLMAALLVAAALAITWGLKKLFPATPNALYFCAIILGAWLGGFGPGVFASVLAAVAIRFTPHETSMVETPRYIVFVSVGVFMSWLIERQRRTQAALQQARDEFEQRVKERTGELTTTNEGLKTEIAARKRTEALLEGQGRALEMMAAGEPLSESLATLVRLIEERVPDMLGSIQLLDEQGIYLQHCAAPSLPPDFVKAIDHLAIGPEIGSCGTSAFSKEAVFVEDIALDSRWEGYQTIALQHGLRACWSTPIFDPQRCVLGTFAMYYRQPALPQREHLQLIEMATHLAALAICRDRSQAVLRESEARLKEAERLANIGYWERDLIGDRIIFSEETYRIFGLQQQDGRFGQAELEKLIHPDDRKFQSETLADVMAGRRRYDLEYRILRPDGEIRFVHVRDDAAYDGAGRAIRVFGTVQDITERRRAEALLHAQAQEIRAIVENSPDIIVRYDLDLHRTYVNPAFVKATGLPREALLGREIASPANQGISNATPEEIALLRESLKRVRDTGQPLDVETSWLMPIGRRSFASHFEPEFDTQGKLRSVLGISRDITELKAGEEKLRQMEAELARMSQLTIMGELAASIAHEINQPLAAVVTNANASLRWLAAAPPNLDEAREAVLRIIRDGNRAGNVIARIRTLLKKGEPVRAPLNINEVVQETIALTQPELARRKVLLQLALASELPRLQADRIQLQQVLLNLMVNALDSLSGVADRVLHIRTEYQAPDAVRVAVKDTGIGVDREQSERLFQAFFTTKPQGLGMGLAISRSIIEAHGGRLWMTPNEGPGVTFQFTLPIQNGDAT